MDRWIDERDLARIQKIPPIQQMAGTYRAMEQFVRDRADKDEGGDRNVCVDRVA